ncbi:MAG TPA: HEAT repeat domain-containing protein [Polyangia bacterium]|nr:HEAT repeat domain-containing protein [Polyangia bacterium]
MRAPLPRLLLFALIVAGPVAAVARPARAAARIEDVEDALAHDRSYKVRVDAALVLGRLHQSRSIPALIGALRDPNPAVRASACQSLGRIGSPIAKDAVAKALVDPTPLVRHMAKEAMKQLGGADTETPPPPAPGAPAIRARAGKKLSFEVKPMADKSNRAGNALRSHMRDFMLERLRPFGDVEPAEHQGMYAVDGVIKDLSTSTRGGDVEVSCAVQLVLSRQPGGGVFLLTSGEATVQRPKRQWRPQQKPGMELEALESAVRSASEDLINQISRQ